jgi:hypothetical protein
MPDADDFDVEHFRALLRGETPKPEQPPARKPPAPAARAAPAKTRNASRRAAKPSPGGKKSRTR